MASSLCSRKRDLFYFSFFAINIPLIFLIDTVTLLPQFLQFSFSHDIRAFYVSTFNDKFFDPTHAPPTWFSFFLAMELYYHAPLSVWAVRALLKDNAMVPVHLMLYGVQAALTTAVCLLEVWSWTDRTVEEKSRLTMLYGPFVALGGFMALDMFFRLRAQILGKAKKE